VNLAVEGIRPTVKPTCTTQTKQVNINTHTEREGGRERGRERERDSGREREKERDKREILRGRESEELKSPAMHFPHIPFCATSLLHSCYYPHPSHVVIQFVTRRNKQTR